MLRTTTKRDRPTDVNLLITCNNQTQQSLNTVLTKYCSSDAYTQATANVYLNFCCSQTYRLLQESLANAR